MIAAVTASSVGSYTAVISNAAGKKTTAPVLLTLADPALLIYKISGTGTVIEATLSTQGAVGGYLLLDRAGQQGAFLWTGVRGRQRVFWIEQWPQLANHSTGPLPKSATLLVADTVSGTFPS